MTKSRYVAAENADGPVDESGIDGDKSLSLIDIAVVLAEHLKLLIVAPLVVGLLALGSSRRALAQLLPWLRSAPWPVWSVESRARRTSTLH